MIPFGTIVTAEQLLDYSCERVDSGEKMVSVNVFDDSIKIESWSDDMHPYTGDDILVREGVAQRLAQANASLKNDGYVLQVAYGYRHPAIQKKYFDDARKQLDAQDTDERALDIATHNLIAIPSIAGHPTGGAVDVCYVHLDGTTVDFGTKIADFTDTNAIITDASVKLHHMHHRMRLHDVMLAAGFAPFYGEWWHYSYGDIEWAYCTQSKRTLYDHISL